MNNRKRLYISWKPFKKLGKTTRSPLKDRIEGVKWNEKKSLFQYSKYYCIFINSKFDLRRATEHTKFR